MAGPSLLACLLDSTRRDVHYTQQMLRMEHLPMRFALQPVRPCHMSQRRGTGDEAQQRPFLEEAD